MERLGSGLLSLVNKDGDSQEGYSYEHGEYNGYKGRVTFQGKTAGGGNRYLIESPLLVMQRAQAQAEEEFSRTMAGDTAEEEKSALADGAFSSTQVSLPAMDETRQVRREANAAQRAAADKTIAYFSPAAKLEREKLAREWAFSLGPILSF
ncbi:MAG: hypothetical protein CMA10_07090 [Euryarchaeota archaeon]|nr:hypothetical protein [Euryarchaeota archaeon]|tara:strand:+ start:4647 stop:5099 length:453 start_codon:yes stop_codon:yes gene_type:complete